MCRARESDPPASGPHLHGFARASWSFPPRPWTSHARWIAPSPHDADVILVGIELGGLMRSSNGGESWQDHPPGVQPGRALTRLAPRACRRHAYEAGGGGAAFTVDAGETWASADEGRDRHYTWSVTVDPHDPDCWYVSTSTGPNAARGGRDPQARIYRKSDGEPRRPFAKGLPEPAPAMPYALVATDGRLLVGVADGPLWESRDRVDSWIAPRLHAMRSAPSWRSRAQVDSAVVP
jgi:hypothetical protein